MKGTLQITVHVANDLFAESLFGKEVEFIGLTEKEIEGCILGFAESKIPTARWQWDDAFQLVWYLDDLKAHYLLCSFYEEQPESVQNSEGLIEVRIGDKISVMGTELICKEASYSCAGCALRNMAACENNACSERERTDGRNVIFVQS